MRKNKIVTPFLLVAILMGLLFTPAKVSANGEMEIAENAIVHVDGKSKTLKILNVTYDNNTYVSLRDMAAALLGTPVQFDVSVWSDKVSIERETPYGARGGENEPFSDEETGYDGYFRYNLKLNEMTVDGKLNKRYTLIGARNGVYDCYMNVSELAIVLDVKMWFDNNELYVDTSQDFSVDMDMLAEREFFIASNAALVGDATTGEIIYEFNGDQQILIASTSKLMNYLCVMDAVAAGQISMDDEVIISNEVSKLSYGEDGVIRIDPETVTNVSDLMLGTLICSSNECAKALAEHVAGSEEAFVEKMNRKAESLGLSDNTYFYNSNGLPVYTDDALPAKVQNRSCAEDMFKLVKHILAVYPQISDFTSIKETTIESLDNALAKNTNPLLYNVEGTFGIKTGTTNGAGCCLITAANVECGDGTHTLISMIFGSESYVIRNLSSELLLEYGRAVITEEFESATKRDESIPANSEEFIRMLIKQAK